MQIIPERRRFRAAGDKRTNELQFSSDSAARDGDDDVDEVGRCIRYSFISWCPTNQPLQAAAASVQLKSRPQKEGSMALACPTRRPPPPANECPLQKASQGGEAEELMMRLIHRIWSWKGHSQQHFTIIIIIINQFQESHSALTKDSSTGQLFCVLSYWTDDFLSGRRRCWHHFSESRVELKSTSQRMSWTKRTRQTMEMCWDSKFRLWRRISEFCGKLRFSVIHQHSTYLQLQWEL